MLSPIEFANEIFEELTFSIDQACAERYWFIACRPARVLGFTQTDVSTVFAHAQRFDLEIEPDIYLSLTYRSFEPSGSFLTLPGITRFELTLTHDGEMVRTYQNEFEEIAVKKDGTTGGAYSLGL
jgi:hypothetical protein